MKTRNLILFFSLLPVFVVSLPLYGKSVKTPGVAFQLGVSQTGITIQQPQPEVIVKNVSTPVKISALIPGDVVPGSVYLIRIGQDGKSAVLAQLNPDASLGATGYSVTRSFVEASTGTIQLQISAALKGQLRRASSLVFAIAVSTELISLPPDPGQAGKATLAGVDSDRDGIRDDVQRLIVFAQPGSAAMRKALADVAKVTMTAIESGVIGQASLRAGFCLAYIERLKGVAPSTVPANAFALDIVNTDERLNRWMSLRMPLSSSFESPTDYKATCTFDPARLKD